METKFIKYLDLKRNGIAEEVTVVKAIEVGKDEKNAPIYEIWFIKNSELDDIDQQRLLEVLQKSARVNDFQPLYSTLADITLGNGVNALDYFHQYVKILYPSGQISKPKRGSVSVAPKRSQYT
jgi:hypothetical protein